MNQRIIYPQPNGVVAIIIPTEEFLASYTVEDLAAKDVPAGVPYKIIDAADVPTDRTFRNAWEADFSAPDGHGLGHDAWAAQKAAEALEQPELDLEQPE
jgi:hypothetical protein